MITSKKNESEEQTVVLRTFTSDFEANLVRAKLQEAGIPCMLADEFFRVFTLLQPWELSG